AKLRAALAAGCRVILCFSEVGTHQLPSRLEGIDVALHSRLVIAYVGPDATSSPTAKKALRFVQTCFRHGPGAADGPRFIVGGKVTTKAAKALTAVKGVAGVLLEDQCSDLYSIHQILAALGGSDRG